MSRVKNNKTNIYSIFDGMAEIYRVKYSGDVYQFRYYDQDSRKHYRRSLRTRDLETAINLARDHAMDILGKKKNGVALFGERLIDLISEYIVYRSHSVSSGLITEGRLGTIRTILKKLPLILGENIKVSELDKNSLYNYVHQRKELSPTVKLVTIRNEQAVINHLVNYFYERERFPFPRFIFEEIKIRKDDVGIRDTFTPNEYKKLTNYFKTFCSLKNCGSKLELRERNIIRNYILILANTGLRVGELKQLRWNDIKEFELATAEDGYEINLVRLVIRGETSKVRATREITVRGGEYLKRLKELKVEGDDKDLVIPHLPYRTYQKNWYKLMEAIGINDHKDRNITYYSMRHYFITLMVSKNENVANIAKITGTSINHIENTYLKFNQSMSRLAALSSIKS
jgi:integrase